MHAAACVYKFYFITMDKAYEGLPVCIHIMNGLVHSMQKEATACIPWRASGLCYNLNSIVYIKCNTPVYGFRYI